MQIGCEKLAGCDSKVSSMKSELNKQACKPVGVQLVRNTVSLSESPVGLQNLKDDTVRILETIRNKEE